MWYSCKNFGFRVAKTEQKVKRRGYKKYFVLYPSWSDLELDNFTATASCNGSTHPIKPCRVVHVQVPSKMNDGVGLGWCLNPWGCSNLLEFWMLDLIGSAPRLTSTIRYFRLYSNINLRSKRSLSSVSLAHAGLLISAILVPEANRGDSLFRSNYHKDLMNKILTICLILKFASGT